ncbi:MAG: FAD-dependent oxidoreductase [Chloroflexi bacterium]|nr:FAD-dependent oxidoreductase [Chloroflexota bacterium]
MTWEKEADVVIVGFGGAGASAAITAHDLGARVLVLEKTAQGGGNTQYAGGSIRTLLDKSKAIEHYYLLCEGTTEKEVLVEFVEESSRNVDWVRQFGAELLPRTQEERSRKFPQGQEGSSFPLVPGAEGVGPRLFVAKSGMTEFGGSNLWSVLSSVAARKGIEVLVNHRAETLITGKEGEVIGVEAEGPAGKIRAMARRAVVLTCGGFENNPGMHLTYLGTRFYPRGTEANTGDGIMMAMGVGADLWHMNATASTFGYKVPEYETAFTHQVLMNPGFIYVDQHGKRFMDEAGTDVHTIWSQVSAIDINILARPRIPTYFVFDDDTRRAGPVSLPGKGRVGDFYRWSDDNLAEVERGWILRAGTMAELARKLGLDSRTLQETVSRYNLACVGAYDPDFQRSPDSLVPVARPPFYAMTLWPAFMNTQGGPKRNARAQVLNVKGQPIRRLYSAGELGSIWGRFYPGGGNVSEALAYGRIAGRNAAAEPPWA